MHHIFETIVLEYAILGGFCSLVLHTNISPWLHAIPVTGHGELNLHTIYIVTSVNGSNSMGLNSVFGVCHTVGDSWTGY